MKHLLFILMLMTGIQLPTLLYGKADLTKGAINQEDSGRGKKEMRAYTRLSTKEQRPENEGKMDGLSLAAYLSTVGGLASLFLVPALGILLLPAGALMGLFAWRDKKRYLHRRGRGLALTSALVGGGFLVLGVISFLAFFLTFDSF